MQLDLFTKTQVVPVRDVTHDTPLAAVSHLDYDVDELIMNPYDYDHIIVAWSGGKDSLACYLYLLTLGIPPGRIELWHHDIDGRAAQRPELAGERIADRGRVFMDWPVTTEYCRAVAEHFGSAYRESFKEGGFYREMMRDEQATAAIWFETPDGWQKAGGKSKKLGTRHKFPQVSPSLSVRWCSAYLKIDVCRVALRNDPRFRNKKTLLISGERAEESANRAKYHMFEPDSADGRDTRYKRHIDRWRPVLRWKEEDVWSIIQRYRVNPHPAYWLGWGRVSCQMCIFGSKNQWASNRKISLQRFTHIAYLEKKFETTIRRDESVEDAADGGMPYEMDGRYVKMALSTEYTEPVIVDEWQLPAGAFGESHGPT